jgi:hypothetical protein
MYDIFEIYNNIDYMRITNELYGIIYVHELYE